MKIELPDNNTLVIDDGNIVIAVSPYGQYVVGLGENMQKVPGLSQETAPEPVYDPHSYVSYTSNGLTVKESVERALNRVYYGIWEDFTASQIGDVNLLREVVHTMIIEGQGRNAVYTLAGGIKKGVREGLYFGVPLAFVMKGFIDGHIQHEDETFDQNTPVLNQRRFEETMNMIFGSGR